jgi:broad specificity phosphatase PhoE
MQEAVTAATSRSAVSNVGAAGGTAATGQAIKRASDQLVIHNVSGRAIVLPWSKVPSGSQLIIFLRHGQTPDNVAPGDHYVLDGKGHTSQGKVLSGHNSVCLTDLGQTQAQEAGQRTVKVFGRDRMASARYVSSPQQRVRETHEGYKKGAGFNGIALSSKDDPRLMERSAGKLTGLTREEAAKQWPGMASGSVFKEASAAYPGGTAPDGTDYPGESLMTLGNRACPALDEHIAENHQTLVVTAHEMTIKTVVEHLETGCTGDHVDTSCTTDKTFEVEVPNAMPLPYAKVCDRWVRVDISEPANRPATPTAERTDVVDSMVA